MQARDIAVYDRKHNRLNSDSILAALMAVLDLASEEEYEPRVQKFEALSDIYVLDTEHTMEDWHNFKSQGNTQKESYLPKGGPY